METTDYCFSFFRKPIQNIKMTIEDIIGHYANRLMLSSSESKRYKTHFDYCTFSGLMVEVFQTICRI